MEGNLFFDVSRLRAVGKNVIIGKTVRIRYPELVEIGDNCIIDDFTYISTALTLGDYVHIAAGCKLIGGRTCKVTMGNLSTLAPNVVISAGSDDYVGGLATPFPPAKYKGAPQYGDITIGRHCIIGAGSVVLPQVVLGEGAAVGALSLVKKNLKAWTLYAGIPVRELRARNRESIETAEAAFLKEHSHV